MKKRLILIFAALLIFSGCSSMQIRSDYNPEYDFNKLKTFTIMVPKKSGPITLTQERLKRAIIDTLQKRGYSYIDRDDANFIVSFHTDVKEVKEIVTDYDTIGLYPYWYWGPPYITKQEYSYDEAKIVIDAVDPSTKKIFWRGVATDLLHDFKTPQERIAYINSVVRKILSSFPSASLKERTLP